MFGSPGSVSKTAEARNVREDMNQSPGFRV